jgi:TPR repeat protein
MMRSAWIMLSLVISGSILARASIGQARAQEVPVTKCDVYAASDTEPQHKFKNVPYDEINPALAVPACEDAVRQYPNNNRLIFQLGRAYSKNNNLNLAAAQFRKAAEQGYPAAEYNLGVMYERGLALKKDDALAVAWYRKAAEQGYTNAQFNLGNMYSNGQGVARNYDEAMKWYRLAADQGAAR